MSDPGRGALSLSLSSLRELWQPLMIGSVKWICEFDLYVLIKSLVSSRPIWVQTPFANMDHHLAIVSKKCAALSQTLTKISTQPVALYYP